MNQKLILKQVAALPALNEAKEYGSTFSRGIRVDFAGATLIFISGTASINEKGESVHQYDLRGQMLKTFSNIDALLASEGASWRNIVRTTCYLKDIDRDYAEFNRVRTEFYSELQLSPFPASTCIQAKLCRPELLVEIEAIAVLAAAAVD